MEPTNTSAALPTPPSSALPAKTLWRKLRAIVYFLLAVLGAMLFLSTLMVGAASWYTSRPEFCNSCHNMEPYYASWKASPHKDVTCIECHFPPGIAGKLRGKLLGIVQVIKYETASAGPRPSAEIPDASCLRSGCHETRLLSGRVDFHGIPFDHTPHMQEGRRGKTLRCTSCHSQVMMGQHMTVTTTTCFLCHFKDQPFNEKLSSCTHCHQIPKKEFDLGGGVKFTHELAFQKGVDCKSCHGDLIRGNGTVPRERCISCHNRESDLARYGELAFMHNKHVTEHNVNCIQCHTPIEHTLDPHKIEHAASDCQSCHPDHHQEQVDLLKGNGMKTIGHQTANLMVDARVECRTCHRVRDVSKTGAVLVRGAYEMCMMCHDAGTVQQFQTYHVALRGALPTLQASLSDVVAAAQRNGVATDRAEKIAAEAGNIKHDLDVLAKGNDVHNMHFARKLIQEIADRLKVLCRELKLDEPKISLPPPLMEARTSTQTSGG